MFATGVSCRSGHVIRRSPLTLNLHACLERSRANGPGVRAVIWFQGCTLHCPGCFNPETHPHKPTLIVGTDELLDLLAGLDGDVEGISVTGGEPMQQHAGLLRLVAGVKAAGRLSIILFSGYTIREIERMPLGSAILDNVDVLIAGRYVRTLHLGRGLRGSSNQIIHSISSRYCLEELESTPPAEIRISPGGDIQISGVAPPGIGRSSER